jgi:hypothetical protein
MPKYEIWIDGCCVALRAEDSVNEQYHSLKIGESRAIGDGFIIRIA